MNFSTNVLLLGLLLASAADAALRTNLYLEGNPKMECYIHLIWPSAPIHFIKSIKRIKEQDRTLKDWKWGSAARNSRWKPTWCIFQGYVYCIFQVKKPSLYSLPEIKYVLLDQQGKEFKLNADSRNIATRVFTLLEDCMARNDLKMLELCLKNLWIIKQQKVNSSCRYWKSDAPCDQERAYQGFGHSWIIGKSSKFDWRPSSFSC